MALATSSSSINWRSAARLSRSATINLCWATVSAGEAGGATVISFGFSRNLSASLRISGGIVAEKNRVWRSFGSRLAIRSTSGMKPMSIIRSASSMTNTLTSDSKILPRSNKSNSRPGVAISTSQPRSSAFCWSPNRSPPISNAKLRFW